MSLPLRWSLVLPVKPRSAAKTRLVVPQADRERLSLAMTADTVAAALACDDVTDVLVVTDDAEVAATVSALGGRTTPDVPAHGLNPALEYGVSVLRAGDQQRAVAALAADLPALTAEALQRALQVASGHRVAVVADATGAGTTLLTATPGAKLPLAFGPGSLVRHVAAGAATIDLGGLEGLRLDVDTLADLQAAMTLGVGPRTAALIDLLRLA